MVYKGHQILSSDVINSSELNILQCTVFLSDSVRNCWCGESIKDSQDFVTSVTLLQERDEQFRGHQFVLTSVICGGFKVITRTMVLVLYKTPIVRVSLISFYVGSMLLSVQGFGDYPYPIRFFYPTCQIW